MRLKTLSRALLRRWGFSVYAIPKNGSETRDGYAYAETHPNATLAPWLADRDFMRAFEEVQQSTLVDIYRLYELWTLVAETAKIGGDIVEVGAWRGGSGCLMARHAQMLNSDVKVWLCDTFSGVVKADTQDSTYRGGEHSDATEASVKRLAWKMGLNNVQTLVGVFPDQTGPSCLADSIRLLHVDVDVYQSAKDIVLYLWGRLPPGAVIVFDDYGFVGCDGVTRFVDDLRSKSNLIYLYNLNGHAVLIKQ
jgi:O-methyltransferase